MAYEWTIAPDELRAFSKRMKHMGDTKFRLKIRQVHRAHARMLVKKIQVVLPKTGSAKVGHVSTHIIREAPGLRKRIAGAKRKEGPRHDTKRGLMSRSIRSHYGSNFSEVEGGGSRAPHYGVNEFGGAVWWVKRKNVGGIRVRGRAQPERRLHRSYASQREKHGGRLGHIIPVRLRSPMFNGGAQGWYFYPTVNEQDDALYAAYDRAIVETVDEALGRTHYFHR